ncbi:MAG: hypothetical protein ACLUVV_05705 [Christensenellales bacterium]
MTFPKELSQKIFCAEVSVAALTGIGLTFPIISTQAFANLFGTGGAPCFIARGATQAPHVMASTFVLLILTGILLMGVGFG